MRLSFVTILLFCVLLTHAQSNDFIILKKKSTTIKTFFKGSQIEFITTNGAYRNAVINEIRNDSIFLKEYIINRIPTTLGFYIDDTIGSYHYAYHYTEIYKFNKSNKKFNVGGSGAALLGGGLLITLASGVVYIADKEKFSPSLLAAGAGLGALGFLISKKSGKGITVGKNKYSLQYITISSNKHEESKR